MDRFLQDDLVYYRFSSFDELPAVDHAVFTRLGGASNAPFASLNLGGSVGDNRACVDRNHQRAYHVLNVAKHNTVTAWLVHGRAVRAVGVRQAGQVVKHVDGLVTQDRDLCLFMRFADCVPLIFYDPVRNAIGIAHAGWRGTLAGVGPATVLVMQRQFASSVEDIRVGVGPGICSSCYAVGDEVVDAVRRAFKDSQSLLPTANGVAHFDIPAANERQLREIGVIAIEHAGICTSCRVDEFYSYRSEGGTTGRFGVGIVLRGNN